MNALDYILKANLYGLLFVGCYWLLLRRHTFFTLNRAYLLASVVLSLLLPLASLPAQTVEADWPVPVGVIALPMTAITTMPVDTGPNWEQIALLAYGLVAFTLLLRLAIRIGRLFQFIQQLPHQVGNDNDYVLVQAPNPTGSEASTPTFSFFRYLVLNPEDVQNELIIRHELVHIRQRHSVDVLALALLRAVFWISPSLWLIDRMLRQVHEFLADKQAGQPTVYARFLVEYAFGSQTDTLTNGFFNPSLLKQRILMLHQKSTNRWALGKYVLVLPLAFGLLAMTTAREDMIQTGIPTVQPDTSIADQTQPESQTSRNGVIFTVVEVVPQFPGGMRALGEYINKNLRYPAEARKKKVEGRVFLRFIVSQTGDVQDVQILKGIGSGCDEEATRVVNQMPKWIPGKQAGRPVNVQYNLPIQFSLEKKEDKRTGQADPAIFKPTGSPIGEFPTMRDVSYPNQPHLAMTNVSVPASSFKNDTLPQSGLMPKPTPAVTIRGRGPLGELGPEPLYIVDGVEIPKATPRPLDKVSPNDIENINVLKGESATSVYGEKGKDGVIVISTKKK
ncbi:TonB family protein [Spirosoma jeollabukense]